jgi:hypothetical protein
MVVELSAWFAATSKPKTFPIIAVQTKLTLKKKNTLLCLQQVSSTFEAFFCNCKVELTVTITRRLMSCFSHLFSLKRALQSTFAPKNKNQLKISSFLL